MILCKAGNYRQLCGTEFMISLWRSRVFLRLVRHIDKRRSGECIIAENAERIGWIFHEMCFKNRDKDARLDRQDSISCISCSVWLVCETERSIKKETGF